MSYINILDDGVVIKCCMCSGPIKSLYFTHSCEFKSTRILNGVMPKAYCYECLSLKSECTVCKKSYMIKSPVSL